MENHPTSQPINKNPLTNIPTIATPTELVLPYQHPIQGPEIVEEGVDFSNAQEQNINRNPFNNLDTKLIAAGTLYLANKGYDALLFKNHAEQVIEHTVNVAGLSILGLRRKIAERNINVLNRETSNAQADSERSLRDKETFKAAGNASILKTDHKAHKQVTESGKPEYPKHSFAEFERTFMIDPDNYHSIAPFLDHFEVKSYEKLNSAQKEQVQRAFKQTLLKRYTSWQQEATVLSQVNTRIQKGLNDQLNAANAAYKPTNTRQERAAIKQNLRIDRVIEERGQMDKVLDIHHDSLMKKDFDGNFIKDSRGMDVLKSKKELKADLKNENITRAQRKAIKKAHKRVNHILHTNHKTSQNVVDVSRGVDRRGRSLDKKHLSTIKRVDYLTSKTEDTYVKIDNFDVKIAEKRAAKLARRTR